MRLIPILLIMAFLFGFTPAFSAGAGQGFGPERLNGSVQYGTGVYLAGPTTRIYAEPDENAPLLEVVSWTPDQQGLSVYSRATGTAVYSQRPFLAFYPAIQVAMMAVLADDDRGWVEVVYDQSRGLSGWVQLDTPRLVAAKNGPPVHVGQFYPWLDFMSANAKANGIYWLGGDPAMRILRQAPEDMAKPVPITVMRNLKVRHVRGSWLLVEVLDLDRSTPMGWIRWRDDDGRLLVFPNLSGKKAGILAGAY